MAPPLIPSFFQPGDRLGASPFVGLGLHHADLCSGEPPDACISSPVYSWVLAGGQAHLQAHPPLPVLGRRHLSRRLPLLPCSPHAIHRRLPTLQHPQIQALKAPAAARAGPRRGEAHLPATPCPALARAPRCSLPPCCRNLHSCPRAALYNKAQLTLPSRRPDSDLQAAAAWPLPQSPPPSAPLCTRASSRTASSRLKPRWVGWVAGAGGPLQPCSCCTIANSSWSTSSPCDSSPQHC